MICSLAVAFLMEMIRIVPASSVWAITTTVSRSMILERAREARENRFGIGEIQAVLAQVGAALGLVPRESHLL
jgi:hypothetical protein